MLRLVGGVSRAAWRQDVDAYRDAYAAFLARSPSDKEHVCQHIRERSAPPLISYESVWMGHGYWRTFGCVLTDGWFVFERVARDVRRARVGRFDPAEARRAARWLRGDGGEAGYRERFDQLFTEGFFGLD